MTRQNSSNMNDKYLDYNSDDSTTDESTSLSSMTTDFSNSENFSDYDYDSNLEEEFDAEKEESKEEKEIKDEIKKILLGNIKKKNNTSGTLFNLLIDDSEESEDEEFLNTISKEEREKLLKIENQISKINHKQIPLRYQILNSNLPIEIKAIAIQKLESIQKMDDSSSEYHKISHWINGLLKIPFGTYVDTNISIETSKPEEIAEYLINVKTKLDESVYGHSEAKSTLLEIVSSWITNPKATPTVIGLQGPPGTGKTTLIKNGVAKALNRPFSMIALGGATDSSYLEGHGYTYEGSNWGKLVNLLMECKCMNPVIFMDELDKVSETKHGEEIIGVLTHLIDYSQNEQIQDRYFSGVPLDFSKALFIFSFNDETKLNPILKDRIYIIRTEASSRENKLVIAKDYLIPNILSNVKFSKEDIVFTDETIYNLIDRFTDSDSGVRNLKRCFESIIMKLNTIRLTYKNPKITASPNTSLLPYYLNDFKLPMTITNDIIDKLLGGTSLNAPKNTKLHMMYI
jgi:ATP-dependent Lon protease